MILEEAQRLKRSTEQEIASLLSKFRKETGLHIDSIDKYAENINGGFLIKLHVSL